MKKGDTVYIVPEDIRCPHYTAKIVSVGRKYITIEGPNGENKFDVKTFYSVDSKSVYNCRRTLYISAEDYKKAIIKKHKRAALVGKLTAFIQIQPLEKLMKISSYFANLK